MISFVGAGGGGWSAQSSDPNFASKLAELKKRGKTTDQRITEFVKDDLGIDPKTLPLSWPSARALLREIMNASDDELLIFEGNSLGFDQVARYSSVSCERCGELTPDLFDPVAYCGVCEEDERDFIPVTDWNSDTKTPDWRDLTRIYDTLRATFGAPSSDHPAEAYTFAVHHDPYAALGPTVTARNDQPRHQDPRMYPTGTLLRLERMIVRDDESAETISEYVRVGGLFNDDEITILASMEPMSDLTGWTVAEEL